MKVITRGMCSGLLALALAGGAAGQSPSLHAADPPARPGALAPNVIVHEDVALVTWLEPATDEAAHDRNGTYRLRLARFDGENWTEPITITERDDFFVNWADVPSVAVASDGAMIAHWPQKSGPGTYAYDVMLARSTDGGAHWQELGPAHDDGTQTEHGFVSMVPEGRGVRAFWLDGREMAGADEGEAGGHGSGSMMVRTTLVTDRVPESVRLDSRVCECCNTSAVMTDDGPLIFYRNRDENEVRDIYLVRRSGRHWTSPRAVAHDGWEIPGCPVNGPAAAATGRTVAVAWYTGADGGERVRMAFSRDAGATFRAPIELDGERAVGRVDVELLGEHEALAVWLDAGLGGGSIVARRVAADGRMGSPQSLASVVPSRRTGFPRLARLGERILLIWTEDARPGRLRAVTFAPGSIPAPPDLPATRGAG